MGNEKIHIEQFLALSQNCPVIDVRSPGEYKHAHIPGAYNLPLFTDEERKIVGTTYKQKSREAAIKIGLDFFGSKMKKMIEEVESLVYSHESGVNKTINGSELIPTDSRPTLPAGRLTTHDSRTLLIYCWRGGMRSAAIAWLMDLYGYKVYTLAGGYKKFRNYVLDIFKLPFNFKILGGFTGSGKTEILRSLKQQGENVIDLEEIANHKGSAFGNIGLPQQPTQEMFENILASELRKVPQASPMGGGLEGAWLEDESQRIGHVNIPTDLWQTIRRSPVYFLDVPFEERLKHLEEEYGNLDKEKMIHAIGRIREKLGGLNAKTAVQLLEDGNISESFRILLTYYDKYYLKALHNREGLNTLLTTINCETVTPENAGKLAGKRQYHHENH